MGLRFSSVTAGSDGTVSHGLLHGATVGSSMLFTVLTKLSLGDAAQYGALVQLSPLAFAGWLGLFITALSWPGFPLRALTSQIAKRCTVL
jgi:hypothetical protein